MLIDDLLGEIAGPFDLATGESQTFQAVAYVAETTTSPGDRRRYAGQRRLSAEASDTTTVDHRRALRRVQGRRDRADLPVPGRAGGERGRL